MLLSALLVLLISHCGYNVDAVKEDYKEEIVIRSLNDGSVNSDIQFITNVEHDIFKEELSSHYNLFPKSFGEIISDFHIGELHLSFTQGRWRYNKWGYPILNAPTGIELWVWFLPSLNDGSVEENWKGLVNALSGQFCSPLNFITKAETTKSKLGFRPLGVWPSKNISESHLRYATLAKETICTENLTPWKKLLPCAGKAGFSSLLNPYQLFDSSYISIGIHLSSQLQTEDSPISLELKQTISSVFHPVHYSLKRGWILEQLYGSKLNSICPLASASQIFVNVNMKNVEDFKISPPTDNEQEHHGVKYKVYDLKDHESGDSFDLSTSYKLVSQNAQDVPYLLSHKYIAGYGQERVGSMCKIMNHHPTKDIKINYMDVLPFFVRPYFHTLNVKVNNNIVKPDIVEFTPAYHRERPTTIEIQLTIPAQSTASISFDFEKVFLYWSEHPPDSNHGYYIGSSVISAVIPMDNATVSLNEQCSLCSRNLNCFHVTSNNEIFRRIYTEPLLIRVPLPDFSMPYNVICLTCTVIAIAFGSMYNITTRTFHVESMDEKNKSLKEKIKSFLGKFTK